MRLEAPPMLLEFSTGTYKVTAPNPTTTWLKRQLVIDTTCVLLVV